MVVGVLLAIGIWLGFTLTQSRLANELLTVFTILALSVKPPAPVRHWRA